MTPVRENNPKTLLRATRFKQLDGIRAAMSRGQLLKQPEIWLTLCHYWPAIPGQATPWRLVPETDAPVSGVEFKGTEEDFFFAVVQQEGGWHAIRPAQEPSGEYRYESIPLNLDVIEPSPNGEATKGLRPDHPAISGRTEAEQAPYIHEYGQQVAVGMDAYYGELIGQTRAMLGSAVHGLQDFPVSLASAIVASGQALPDDTSIVASGEAGDSDLQVFFDGTQCYRLRLTYPSGMVQDEVMAFRKISVRDGVEYDYRYRAEFEKENPRIWQFIGGIKVPPFEDRVKKWSAATQHKKFPTDEVPETARP